MQIESSKGKRGKERQAGKELGLLGRSVFFNRPWWLAGIMAFTKKKHQHLVMKGKKEATSRATSWD